MREVLKASSPFCSIPEAEIRAYFEESYAPKVGCRGDPPENCRIPTADSPPPLLEPARPQEVAQMLRRTSNTAPGPDGIKYAVWRRRDPSGHVLAAIFNRCLAARKFPPAWKQSSTILIHKKGSVEEITNWRPIALSNTAGKLFCSLLASRLSKWSSDNHLISGAQKGFTPSEGCLEHNFILQELLDETRRRGDEVCLAWLDLANAFGSVPHETILHALRTAGLTGEQVSLIEDLYVGSSTTIRHNGGSTPSIPFRAGVRQGCPLSPILFNLVIEHLIRPVIALQEQHGAILHGTNISTLAYADDLALIAKSEASLQVLLDATSSAANWVGLHFKPSKCATLHVAQRTARQTLFRIEDEPLKVLGEGEAYQHLGVPTGLRVDQSPNTTIARLEEEAAAIFNSSLAPWQKLNALRTFLVPQLEFNMLTARVKKTSLKKLDDAVRAGCKKTLGLPSRASAELVYLPPSMGGAGLVPLADQTDLASINQIFRLLTSPDPKVAHLALEGLASSAGQRGADRSNKPLLASYLNGEIVGNTNVRTTFSSARAALNRLAKRLPDLKWSWCQERDTFTLTIPGERRTVMVDRHSRHGISSSLRNSIQLHYRHTLTTKPDQGRVARVSTTCPTANHMLHEGRYTRFADWRFIHRARLNVLPLNGCRRWGAEDRRCRRCGQQDETTAHVLCHCLPGMPTITKRHDAVLRLLTEATRPPTGAEMRVDKQVPLATLLPDADIPEETQRLRPDLVLIDDNLKTVKIVDVTCPYEDGWNSIAAARNTKLEKYEPISQLLTAGGYTTSIDAFVVGSLGAWDNNNWSTLRRLGVNRRFGTTLARRCVSEAIRWSRDIYVHHVTGVQQHED